MTNSFHNVITNAIDDLYKSGESSLHSSGSDLLGSLIRDEINHAVAKASSFEEAKLLLQKGLNDAALELMSAFNIVENLQEDGPADAIGLPGYRFTPSVSRLKGVDSASFLSLIRSEITKFTCGNQSRYYGNDFFITRSVLKKDKQNLFYLEYDGKISMFMSALGDNKSIQEALGLPNPLEEYIEQSFLMLCSKQPGKARQERLVTLDTPEIIEFLGNDSEDLSYFAMDMEPLKSMAKTAIDSAELKASRQTVRPWF